MDILTVKMDRIRLGLTAFFDYLCADESTCTSIADSNKYDGWHRAQQISE